MKARRDTTEERIARADTVSLTKIGTYWRTGTGHDVSKFPWHCSCPDFKYSEERLLCKHVVALAREVMSECNTERVSSLRG